MTIPLTEADKHAIVTNDSNYLNTKGASYYAKEEYEKAVEYYHLASAMGNVIATSNLGYCYLYGRSIPVNVDLAIGYFQVAAANGNVDALYKLGDIHQRDKWGHKDDELAVYYYQSAVKEVLEADGYNPNTIRWCEDLEMYPSLCLALARVYLPGGFLKTNYAMAYQFLLKAKAGYEVELSEGHQMYRRVYEATKQLLQDHGFDLYREAE